MQTFFGVTFLKSEYKITNGRMDSIGIDENKEIDLKHREYLIVLQHAFIDLYEKGYIKYDKIELH